MLHLRPEILRRNGKNQFVILPWEDFQQIEDALEDLADLRPSIEPGPPKAISREFPWRR